MSKIIELKNVNKWFDKFQVLKDINLEVAPQETGNEGTRVLASSFLVNPRLIGIGESVSR